MKEKNYIGMVPINNGQCSSDNAFSSALIEPDTSVIYNPVRTTKLSFDGLLGSSCDSLTSKSMLNFVPHYGIDTMSLYANQLTSEICVFKDKYLVDMPGIRTHDFKSSALSGINESFQYKENNINAGLITFNDRDTSSSFIGVTDISKSYSLQSKAEDFSFGSIVNDCSAGILTRAADHLRFYANQPIVKECYGTNLKTNFDEWSSADLDSKIQLTNYCENYFYDRTELFENNLSIEEEHPSIWAQDKPSFKTVYPHSIYGQYQTNIGVGLKATSSEIAVNNMGLNRYTLRQPNEYLFNTVISESGLRISSVTGCDSTSINNKLFGYKQEISSIGICNDFFSFYSKNTISRTLFENRFVGLLNGLRTGPDHIGFEYSHSNESQTINIYMIFVGPINGENINIGDHITYINR